MPRTLIVGFGNIDRADDGVAWHIVNAVRSRLGVPALPEDTTGLDELDPRTGTVFVSQLTPELIDVVANYDRIVFVDAHIDDRLEPLHSEPIHAEAAALTFSHHMTPAMLLAMAEGLHNAKPAAHLVSVRGYDFDFHRKLSTKTWEGVDAAAKKILALASV